MNSRQTHGSPSKRATMSYSICRRRSACRRRWKCWASITPPCPSNPDVREPYPPAQQTEPPRVQNAAIQNGAVLAFDFGEQRIGAAVGDTGVGIAHPLTTISAADKKTRY